MNVHARHKLPDHVYDTLAMYFGGCPHCQASNVDARYASDSSGTVYRTSRRSVTMRCRFCGMLWTMTVHQMAKAARPELERLEQLDCRDVYDERAVRRLRALDQWARNVGEARGRARGPSQD